MEVNDALIDNLANLARLKFSEQEKAEIRGDLQRMIAFVEKLKEVDTARTEPLLHMSEALNVYREDEVKGSMSKAEALANAPSTDKDYFNVPRLSKNEVRVRNEVRSRYEARERKHQQRHHPTGAYSESLLYGQTGDTCTERHFPGNI